MNRLLFLLLWSCIPVVAPAQRAATERVLHRVERHLERQLGIHPLRRCFRLYADASYRVYRGDFYSPLLGTDDRGLPVDTYQLNYVAFKILGRDTLPLGVASFHADSNGRLLPARPGFPHPKRSLRAWSDLYRNRLPFGWKQVLAFRKSRKLDAYRISYECRDAGWNNWDWYLSGPVRERGGGTEYREYRIDARSGRWSVSVIRPAVEKGPPAPLHAEPPDVLPEIDSVRAHRHR